ncbi:MAG: Gfo/Idh/MocA family oxidoreductase [Verrucomicrobiota bacterium]
MIRIAIVGTGGMANSHAHEFQKIKGCKIVAVCDVDTARAAAFAEKYHVKRHFSNLTDMLNGAESDAVSIVTPDSTHAKLGLQAVAAGQHVLCEKPLAANYPDALKMARAAARKGVINMINFSYRNASAIQKAASILASGELGQVVHVHGSYLQSWLSSKVWGDWKTSPAWLWRLSSSHGSRGVLGDVGVHLLDFATFPVGPAKNIGAKLKVFSAIKGKSMSGYTLDANDSALITLEFAGGALASLHTSRWATGHSNSVSLIIHAEHGAIRVDLDKSNTQLEICRGKDVDTCTWKTLDCGRTPSIYERFVQSIRTGINDQPDFARGAEIQKLLDACYTSNESGTTVKV